MELVELIAKAREWDEGFSEIVGESQLDISPDGALIFGENSATTDQAARNRLLAAVGAPTSYFHRRSIALQTGALREHLQQGDFGHTPKIILRNGGLFTISRSDLVELGHAEVLAAVLDSLGAQADGLSVSRIAHSETNLDVNLVTRAKALEIRQGDVVQAGLEVSHSHYSDQATQIHGFLYRLVCSNGMMRRECLSREGIVRTRKLPVNHPRGKELVLEQVRRLTARTWERLDPQLEELRATSQRSAHVEPLLRQWLQRARLSTRVTDPGRAASPTLMDRLLSAWREEGAENTYYGAVNALTRVASHDASLSQRRRRVLSLLAGVLAFSGVHLCPRCFSVLSDSASAPT